MTKESKDTALQFHIEKLENRDAPRMSGQLIRDVDFQAWAEAKKDSGTPGRTV